MKNLFAPILAAIGLSAISALATAAPANEPPVQSKTTILRFSDNELKSDVRKEYNKAQMSLNKKRNYILNELVKEQKKGNSADLDKVILLSCGQLVPIIEASISNDEAILKEIKGKSVARKQLIKQINDNKQALQIGRGECQNLMSLRNGR